MTHRHLWRIYSNMKFLSEREMQAKTLLRDGEYKSIREILDRLVKYKPEAEILAGLDDNKKVFKINSVELREEVMNLGDGLIAMGLQGKHIAIVADNSCRYVISDICISSGVGVVTPIDVEADVNLLITLFSKCDAEAVLCSARCLDRIEEAAKSYPALSTIITIDKKIDGYLYYEELLAKGQSLKDNSIYRNIDVDLEAPAKILFTSGTTGANKAVVLTNGNLIANTLNCMDAIRAEEGNIAMSILPMHHATEINTHIMCRIAGGRLTYINDSIRNMMTNIRIFKPDTITIVPMIANSFFNGIWATAQKQGKADKLRKGIKISNLLRKFGIDKTHEMFAELFAPFGGKLHMIVCGGAMLNPNAVKGMNDLGVRMENGYGITECGPLISINSNTLEEYKSVGKPCPGLEAKIFEPDEQGVGELCVRGKSVAKGYYKDLESTAKAFDADGFFHTGDSAYLDSKGRIYLVGRKKNTIILENGKNVCPEEVENAIETALPYPSDIVVYQAEMVRGGNACKVICAGLYIQEENARSREEIEADIRALNQTLPSYKRIEYVELPPVPYQRSSTRKILRTNLPAQCSGEGITL